MQQETNFIPQPKQIPVFGNVHQIDNHNPAQSLIKLVGELGPIYKLNMAGSDLIVVSDPKIVDELCNEKRFKKKLHRPLQEIRHLAKDALFTANTDEPNWQKAHRILMPVFGPLAIREMYGDMLDIASQLVMKWERLGDHAVIDIADNMTRLTLDTIALATFDYRFNSFYEKDMHPFVDHMTNGLEEASFRSRRPKTMNNLPTPNNRNFFKEISNMHKIANEILEHRKDNPRKDGRKDLIDTMLNMKDPVTGEKLSDENIRNQMVTFLIAGHETTSGMLSFTFYELLKNPEVLQRARQEIEEVVGDRIPTLEDISKLHYLDQILKESLRLWPTAPAFAVHSVEDETIIGEKYKVSKDDILFILLPTLHRNPSIWKTPQMFDPDRMEKSLFQALPKNAWKPFGNGVRSCIGRAFAMQEAMLVLALTIKNFDFEFADPNYQLKIKESLTLKPDNLKIKIKKVKNEPIFKLQSNLKQEINQDSSNEMKLGSKAESITVLYGSNTGTSESFAKQFAAGASAKGHQVKIGILDEYTEKLQEEQNVVILVSSYNGQPPHNAKIFYTWLRKNKELDLSHLKFSIFGCGNRDWPKTYQLVPRKMNEFLLRSGATQICEIGESDAKDDVLAGFEEWKNKYLEKIELSLEN